MLNFPPSLLSAEAVDQYTWSSMLFRDTPSAEDYLAFAKQDLLDGRQERHRVNSLSNVKRALHLRLEDLCFGFGATSLRKPYGFPTLLQYVRNCGLVAPDILGRLNKLRNEVEHDYATPSTTEVETHIDVTELFLAATDRWKHRQPCEASYWQVITNEHGQFTVTALSFDWKNGIASVKYRTSAAKSVFDTQAIDFRSPSPEYFECVKFLLANDY